MALKAFLSIVDKDDIACRILSSSESTPIVDPITSRTAFFKDSFRQHFPETSRKALTHVSSVSSCSEIIAEGVVVFDEAMMLDESAPSDDVSLV